jgi:hypothetical protein
VKIFKWQTLWTILGPSLPGEETSLGDGVIIAPLTEDEFARINDSRQPQFTIKPSTTDCFVVNHSHSSEVQSRHRLQIDVEAPNEGYARRRAMEKSDRLILSLSLAAAKYGRYYAEFLKIHQADHEVEWGAWTTPKSAWWFDEVAQISRLELETAAHLINLTETSPAVNSAYTHLLTAWSLHEIPGSTLLKRSILQHYVLCIEAIVKSVMKFERRRLQDRIRPEEKKYAEEFSTTLSVSSDKSAEIRKAARQLQVISLDTARLGIEHASGVLGVPEEDARSATELYGFRSRALSHPGEADDDSLRYWLERDRFSRFCRADRLARTFLVAFSNSPVAEEI